MSWCYLILASISAALAALTGFPTRTPTFTVTPTSQPGEATLIYPADGGLLPQPVPPGEWYFRMGARHGPCYTRIAIHPGYWVNRIGYAQRGHWEWARQRHHLAGVLGALFFGGILAAMLLNYAQAGLSLNPATWRLLFDASLLENLATLGFMLIFLLLFIASLLLFFRKPGRSAKK